MRSSLQSKLAPQIPGPRVAANIKRLPECPPRPQSTQFLGFQFRSSSTAPYLLLTVALLLTGACGGADDGPETTTMGAQSAPATAATAELWFDSGSAPLWTVVVELPASWAMTLEVGTRELTLLNRTGSPISFGEPVTSCACIQGRLVGDVEVPIDAACTLLIQPTWAWAGDYRQSLWLPVSSPTFENGVVRVDVVGTLPGPLAQELIVPPFARSSHGVVRLSLIAVVGSDAEPSPISFAWITESGAIAVEPVEHDGWHRLPGSDGVDASGRQMWQSSVVIPEPRSGRATLLAVTNRISGDGMAFHAAKARQVQIRQED